uniref:Uncharacterized protein n=1 Tax=Cucumis melo TaxID=3656 RepID=A0A9I9E4R2_CUCME
MIFGERFEKLGLGYRLSCVWQLGNLWRREARGRWKDQVNWRILLSTREYLCLAKISRVVPAWVSFGITTYLGLCGPTGRQSSMYIDMIRVIRRGPRIPIVLVLPPGSLQTSMS